MSCTSRYSIVLILGAIVCLFSVSLPAAAALTILETDICRLVMDDQVGTWELTDLRSQTVWGPASETPMVSFWVGPEIWAIHEVVPDSWSITTLDDRTGQVRVALPADPGNPVGDLLLRFELGAAEPTLTVSYAFEMVGAWPTGGIAIQGASLLNRSLKCDGLALAERSGVWVEATGEPIEHWYKMYYPYCMKFFAAQKGNEVALVQWEGISLRIGFHRGDQNDLTASLAPHFDGENAADQQRFTITLLGEGDYVDAALAYRQSPWAQTNTRKLSDKINQVEQLEWLLGAAIHRTYHSIWIVPENFDYNNRSDWDRIRHCIEFTFDQARLLHNHLHDLGFHRIMHKCWNWQTPTLEPPQVLPDYAPVAPEAGGLSGLEQLKNTVIGHQNLFNLYHCYADVPDWCQLFTDENIVQDKHGNKLINGYWWTGTGYLFNQRAAAATARRELRRAHEEYGANAVFVDTILALPVRANFAPPELGGYSKAEEIEARRELSNIGRQEVGVIGTEDGWEFGVAQNDYGEGIMHMTQGPYKNVQGRPIPLFELVYRDSFLMYPRPWDYTACVQNYLDLILNARQNVFYWYHTGAASPMYYDVQDEVTFAADGTFPISHGAKLELGNYTSGGASRPAIRLNPPDKGIVALAEAAFSWTVPGDVQGPLSLTFDYGIEDGSLPNETNPGFELLIGDASIWQDTLNQTGWHHAEVPLVGAEPGQPVEITLVSHPGPGRNVWRIVRAHQLWSSLQLKDASGSILHEQAELELADLTGRVRPETFIPFLCSENRTGPRLGVTDTLLQTLHEVLTPLAEQTALLPMVSHRFLGEDQQIERTHFGLGDDQIRIIVNRRSSNDYAMEDCLLPPYGFIVQGPNIFAAHVKRLGRLSLSQPALVVASSQNEKPVMLDPDPHFFRAFGPADLDWPKVIKALKTTTQAPCNFLTY